MTNSNAEDLRKLVEEFPDKERMVKHMLAEEDVSLRVYQIVMAILRQQRASLVLVENVCRLLEGLEKKE